ncbi:MAG: hypothetical protein FWH37_05740 [Candidatus Bathyarchaeota archaeon]|nr:hypothetical protein [Candidatus Termiticorpusculum sp.]
MPAHINPKTNLHNTRRRNLIIISLLVVVLVCSSFVYVSMINNGGEVHVKSEVELVRAIDNVKIGESTIIVLDKDITLTTGEITIPSYKEITLTSKGNNQFKLIAGINRISTIMVESGGFLVIDGICVTHLEGVNGIGVNNMGTFNMCIGEISGNFGASGVSNRGTFTMSGGKITNNSCYTSGGGVTNSGTFTMSGGEITGNKADMGGGVSNDGTFNWIGGEIFDNIANTDENVHDAYN